MNYSEMSDAEINRMVARFIHPRDQSITPYNHRPDVQVFHRNSLSSMFDYCNSWADAGPVIQDNQISLDAIYQGGPRWLSFAGDDGEFRHTDANALRAAMIVFLMMREEI